jgi:cytochrome c oxidase subunit 2
MLSKVEVMEKADFDTWYASDKLSPHDKTAPQSEGETIYKTLGCASCHSLDGSIIVGPSFKGIYGKTIKVLTNGKPREVLVDDAYIRDSVRTPSKDVVEGFPDGIMPNFSDQINEAKMTAIIAFIKDQGTVQNNPVSTTTSVSELNQTSQGNKTSAPVGKTEIKPQHEAIDGASLFTSQGCVGCHSLDGSVRVGPSLKGIYESRQKVLTNGKLREITANEGYLHNSIQHPNDDIVKGFPSGVMPPFGTMLSEEEIDALVKYLKSIK